MYKNFLPMLAILVVLQAHADPGSISVNGNAVVWVEPDLVRVTLEIRKIGDTAALTNRAVKQIVKEVLDVARTAGIAEKDIETTGVFFSEVRRNNQCRADQINASQNITVVIRDVTRVETLLDQFVETTALVASVQPGASDMEKYQTEALRLAVEQAKENAAKLGEQLQIPVGKPVNVAATLSQPRQSLALSSSGGRGRSSYIPGKIQVQQGVHVVFESDGN